jgi:poly(3-hydroxybutyrate) depolymerase
VGTEQKHLEVPGAGHYGIFSGRRWRDVVYPEVKSFILRHQPVEVQETPVSEPKQAPAGESIASATTNNVVKKAGRNK